MVTLDGNSDIVRNNLIEEEVEKINNHFAKFGHDFKVNKLAMLFYNKKTNYPGSLIKNINFIIRVLMLANFSPEEAISFIVNHYRFILEDKDYLHLKFAILNKAGILEQVLKTEPEVLLKLSNLKTERLYALICYAKARNQSIDFKAVINSSLPVSKIDELVSTYELNSTINSLLNDSLDKDLKFYDILAKKENKYTKK